MGRRNKERTAMVAMLGVECKEHRHPHFDWHVHSSQVRGTLSSKSGEVVCRVLTITYHFQQRLQSRFVRHGQITRADRKESSGNDSESHRIRQRGKILI